MSSYLEPKDNPEDIQSVEGDMIRMWDICKAENNEDYVFTIQQMTESRHQEPPGGGRGAYNTKGYKESKIRVLKKLKYIEPQPNDTFKLSKKGKSHCRGLESKRIV